MAKLVKVLCVGLFGVGILFGAMLWGKARKSQQLGPWLQGRYDSGALKPCSGEKPNCASTVGAGRGDFWVQGVASPTPADLEVLWTSLPKVLAEIGAVIVKREANYIHATYTSSTFGFVDDLEFYRNKNDRTFEMRSMSRVGYSDLGANRARLLRVKGLMESYLPR